MSRTRLLTLLLTLALALAAAPAVTAQEESPAADAGTSTAFDPASIPEFQRDEALAAYALFRDELLAMGVAEEDLGEATAYLEGEAQAEMTEEAGEVEEEAAEVEEEMAEGQEELQDEKDEAKEEVEEAKEQISD